MKGKKNKFDKDNWIGILAIFIMISFIVGLILIANYRESAVSEIFCKSKGYDGATDEKKSPFEIYKVECDKKYIFEVNQVFQCGEYNKWGDCKAGSGIYFLEEEEQ